jgi:hypothetical protein
MQMIHKKYVSLDSENEKQEYVYRIIAEKKGHYLTDYIVEAVLRYESYKRTEEQKKLSKFLNDDQTDHMQETKNVTEETFTEDSKPIRKSNDTKKENVPKIENIEESNDDDLEVNDIDNVEDDDNEISDATIQDMISVFKM